jgi:surfactin synthase thioesterase subunit
MQRQGIISTAETLESFNQYLQNGLQQYEAYRSYTPPPLQMPCLIARAGEQEEAIKKLLHASGKPEMLGWENCLQGQVTTIELKGDHVSMIRGKDKKDNDKVLAKSILSFLQPNGKH